MWMIRVLFVIVSSLVGYICSLRLSFEQWQGLLAGFLFAIILVTVEFFLRQVSLKDLLISLTGLIAGLVAVFGVPWGNRSFKDLVFRIVESKSGMNIKERIFCELFDDVVFYVNSVSPKDMVMKDLFVMDRRDVSVTNTIIAREGRIILHPGSRMITIHFLDGTIFMVEKDLNATRTVRFNTYDLNIGLSDIMSSLALRKKAPKEMFVQELVDNLNKVAKGEVKYNEMVVELLERLSIPLAVFFMGLIGAPLGSQIRTRARSFGIFIGLVIFLIYYMCYMGVRSLCETGSLSPFIGMWFPDMFLIICCVFLLWRAASDRSINIFEMGARLKRS